MLLPRNYRSTSSFLISRRIAAMICCLGLFHSCVVRADATFADDQLIYGGNATTVQWGDLDGDGIKDLFIAEGGKHSSGNSVLSWFKGSTAPTGEWQEYSIGPDLTRFTGDSDVVDVDGDGHLDVIVPNDDHGSLNPPGRMQWYRNPGNLASNPNQNWTRYSIENNVPDAYHQGDLETADVDNDGKLDIVVRSLGVNRFVVYFQNNPLSNAANAWTKVRINSPYPREGLVLGDLDGDDKADIIGNGFILFAPANPRACTDANPADGIDRCMATWPTVTFDANYYNANQSGLNNSTKGELYDMDGDGRPDILQSSAEGNSVYLAWFKNPSNARTGSWVKNIIESPQGRNHNVQVGDVDLDGDIDVLGGFSFGSNDVVWWENTNGAATSWTRHEIDGQRGCYSCVAADYDNDGDVDFAGPTRYAREVYLYRNTTADGANQLLVSPSSLSYSAGGGSQNLSISSLNISDDSGVPWTASSDQAWLTLSQTSGSDNSSVNVVAALYTGFGNRTATVTVSNGAISRSVSISQAGASDTVAPTVPNNLASSNISFDSFALSWNASTDNSGQAVDYIVYSGGVEITRSSNTSVSLTGLQASTIYAITVTAVDPSGNESSASAALAVITLERPATPAPTAHWKFDESSGTVASDQAGGNNGSLTGGLNGNQWENSQPLIGDGALRFDGGSERVSLGNMDGPSTAITLIGWIRPSDIANNDEGRIISKASGGNANQHIWMLSTDKNTSSQIVPRVRLNTGGSTKTLLGAGSSPVANNVWSQIIATYDGSLIKLFHNGAEVGSVSASGLIKQDASVAAAIGNQPAADRGFVGLIDDVCMLDYAISPEDVSYLYNSGAGRGCDSLGSTSNEDITPPSLAEITPVPTPSFETSPGYVFATNEAGIASFAGSCFAAVAPFEVAVGEIVFGFEDLAFGTYSDCSIIVTDESGNASQPLQVSEFTILERDITAPTVTVNQAADQADPTNSNIARFVVRFSEAINPATFSASDISLVGTSGRVTVGPNSVNANSVFTFSVTGMGLDDIVTASIAANVVKDPSGNNNESSTSRDNQVTYECQSCVIDDEDGDGIDALQDNCPDDANPDQADTDQDGIGDICEDDELCFPIKVNADSIAVICL